MCAGHHSRRQQLSRRRLWSTVSKSFFRFVLDSIVVKFCPHSSEYGRWQRGGNASNNCTVLAQLGISCEFLGCISTAVMFEFVVADMIARGIRYSNCPRHDCDVPLSSILLNSATNSRTIIHSNPNMPILTAEDFKRVNLNNYRWIHFEVSIFRTYFLIT